MRGGFFRPPTKNREACASPLSYLVDFLFVVILHYLAELQACLRLDFGREVFRKGVYGPHQRRHIVSITHHRDKVQHHIRRQDEVTQRTINLALVGHRHRVVAQDVVEQQGGIDNLRVGPMHGTREFAKKAILRVIDAVALDVFGWFHCGLRCLSRKDNVRGW